MDTFKSTLGMAMRMWEYAVHSDYAHMREYVDVGESQNDHKSKGYLPVY